MYLTSMDSSNLISWTLSGGYDDDRPILVDASDSNRFFTKAQAKNLVARLAGVFRQGSTICLHLHNDILYPILVLAILASKCRWTGTLPVYTTSELEHHFRNAEVDHVITSVDLWKTVSAGVQRSGRRAEMILFTDVVDGTSGPSHHNPDQLRILDGTGVRSLRDLLRDRTTDELETTIGAIPPESTAVLMQTSGTTGMPKLAARTHRSLMVELNAVQDNHADKPYPVRRLFCTPITHAFTFPEMVFNSLRLGLTTVIMKRFNDTFAQIVQDQNITEIFVAPPILLHLVNTPHLQPHLQSIHSIAYAGCSLTPSLRQRTLRMFSKPPRIVPVYGMTEGGWFSTLKYPEEDHTGSVGRAIPGYMLRVSTSETVTLDDGSLVGELQAFGPQMMVSYLNDDVSTENAFTPDSWLKTGDIGYINDGKVYLVDRAKDLIKVNGFQISPAEIENALTRLEDVQDAAVFGVASDVNEHPMACVLPRSKNVTENMIIEHLRTTLAGYKVAKCEIRFVDSIPKSPAGKTLRKVLREQMGY